jgi:hypothetical protein
LAGAPSTADGVHKVALLYSAQSKITAQGFGMHSLRATVATNPLQHDADIAKVQA